MVLEPACVPLPVPGGCGGLLPSPSSIGADVVGALLSALAGWATSTASWLLGLVGALLTRTTTVPVTAGWFVAKERLLLAAAAPLALLALLAGVLHALLRGALDELWRLVVLRLPVAFLLGGAAAGLVGLAVAATDALSASVAAGTGTSLSTALHALARSVLATGGEGGPVAVLVGLLVVLGALALWVELVIRAAAITVLTALLPFVLAASLWPPAVAWARRLAETLGALIVSKAVIVLVLSLALGALAHATAAPGDALTGGALLLLAAFTPYVVLKLVPLVEGAAVAHLETVRSRALAAGRQGTRQAVNLALGAADATLAPTMDLVGSNPIGMLPGTVTDDEMLAGTALDPTARHVKGPPPLVAVPASAGTHVWERDAMGPRLVWKPPGWRPDHDAEPD